MHLQVRGKAPIAGVPRDLNVLSTEERQDWELVAQVLKDEDHAPATKEESFWKAYLRCKGGADETWEMPAPQHATADTQSRLTFGKRLHLSVPHLTRVRGLFSMSDVIFGLMEKQRFQVLFFVLFVFLLAFVCGTIFYYAGGYHGRDWCATT